MKDKAFAPTRLEAEFTLALKCMEQAKENGR